MCVNFSDAIGCHNSFSIFFWPNIYSCTRFWLQFCDFHGICGSSRKFGDLCYIYAEISNFSKIFLDLCYICAEILNFSKKNSRFVLHLCLNLEKN